MELVALIAGIAALVFVFVKKLKFIGVILGIAAVVLGIITRVALGWIGCILGIIAVVLFFILAKMPKKV